MRRFSRRPRRRILPRSSPAELTEVDRLELGRPASVGERDSYRDLARVAGRPLVSVRRRVSVSARTFSRAAYGISPENLTSGPALKSGLPPGGRRPAFCA
jgi:hypothetical protein